MSDSSKYEKEAIELLHKLDAKVVLIAVIDGLKGTGSCMAGTVSEKNPRFIVAMSTVLRAIANEMEKNLE